MPKTIRPRGDLKTNWESKNPILNIREMGIEWAETIGKGKVKLKFGNGVTHWNDLDYALIPNESGILYNTKVGWETDNPILKINEMGIEWAEIIGVGSISIKLGNGITPWNELNYGISDDITDKIISTIVPPLESDKNPILSEGDTIGEVAGKLNVQHNYLKEKLGYERLDALANTLSGLSEKDFVGILSYLNNTKFDKVDLYDGTDSSSIELGATANAVRKVNEKTDNNASNISILNSNLAGQEYVLLDLNTLTDSSQNGYTKSCTNVPPGTGNGYLEVVSNKRGLALQRYTPYSNSATYIRQMLADGTWSSWQYSIVNVTSANIAAVTIQPGTFVITPTNLTFQSGDIPIVYGTGGHGAHMIITPSVVSDKWNITRRNPYSSALSSTGVKLYILRTG